MAGSGVNLEGCLGRVLGLILVLLSACIPIGSFVRTEHPRRGIWVTDNGYAWAWHVDQPEVVRVACAPGGPHGCVRWVPGQKTGEIWMIDSAVMAAHECAHALGFSRALTQEDIDREVNHVGDNLLMRMLGPGGPAKEKPCE